MLIFRRVLIYLFLVAGCLIPISAAVAAIAPVEAVTLESGSTLLVRRDAIAPRVAISLLVRVGAANENAVNAGWRQVLAASLLRATVLERNSETENTDEKVVRLSEWQSRIEAWGGKIGATVDDDAIEFWIAGDSAHTAELAQILVQIVLRPRLSDEDFAAGRRRVLTLQSQAGAGAGRAAQAIARQLYRDAEGAPVAYALPNFGTFDSLSAPTNEQLRAWHAQYFVPGRLIVAAAGDVRLNTLRGVLEKVHRLETRAPAAVPAASTLADKAPPFAALNAVQPPLVVREMSVSGAWVFAAFRAPAPSALSPKDHAALKVLASALDGSALARLPRRLLTPSETIRGLRPPNPGLAARVATQFTSRRWASELTVFAQTGPQNVESVKNALLDEVRKLRDTPLSEAELQGAKNFARGQWSVEREDLHERAFATALAALHATPAAATPVTATPASAPSRSSPDAKWPEWLAQVTSADVQRVAQKYLRVYSVVLIMPVG